VTQTRQLRRYDIQPGAMDAFVEWFRGPLMQARASHGFTAESAYVDALENTVTWVARFDGTEAEFLTAERIYDRPNGRSHSRPTPARFSQVRGDCSGDLALAVRVNARDKFPCRFGTDVPD